MNFCRYCGSKLEEHAKFCTNCGKSIEVNDNINSNQTQTINYQANNNNNQPSTINYQYYQNNNPTSDGSGFIVAAIIMFVASYLLFFLHPFLFLLLRIGILGVLVTGFITYPKNTGIKIFFWGYIVILILDIILVVLSIIACNNLLESLSGCN